MRLDTEQAKERAVTFLAMLTFVSGVIIVAVEGGSRPGEFNWWVAIAGVLSVASSVVCAKYMILRWNSRVAIRISCKGCSASLATAVEISDLVASTEESDNLAMRYDGFPNFLEHEPDCPCPKTCYTQEFDLVENWDNSSLNLFDYKKKRVRHERANELAVTAELHRRSF